MNEIVVSAQQVRGLSRLRDNALVLGLFAGTMFLSALLLFSVQPVFAKMVLPTLGGSPSVWAISMCFFQAVLLVGYCYAHAMNRFMPVRYAPMVHLGLLAIALLALPFGLPAGVEPPQGDAYLWLISVLTIGVGLPFLAVSASAPLLQSWFARTGHPHANDPYFLYGASNLGSLAALLAYPFAVEPFWGLTAQAQAWTSGFVALICLIGVCGLAMLVCGGGAVADQATSTSRVDARPLNWADRLAWIGLAFVPSGLLVAFSSYVTTDVASAPFIWVMPLAVFLATFILVFRETPLIPHEAMLVIQPVCVVVTLMGLVMPGSAGWVLAAVGGVLAFFVTTMVAHRQLYLLRPEPQHLTEFYLWMSFGGVVGGVFAAIIAPQMFSALYEFPLLLLLGMVCRPKLAATFGNYDQRREAVQLGVAGLAVIAVLALVLSTGVLPVGLQHNVGLVLISGCGVAMLLSREKVLAVAAASALACVGLLVLPNALNMGDSERSFFGVHRVVTERLTDASGKFEGEMRVLFHGTTLHGIERITDADGRARAGAPIPSSYYHPDSPLFHGLAAARKAFAPVAGKAFSAGIVGLGTGTMACHAKANEAWRLFEIDPVVVKIAQTRFSYLSSCLPNAQIVVGDARLTLAKEPAARFDYLMIDAFSSDAIPVHMLTREALMLYLDKMAPNGVLALHVSNRHLDLLGVTGAIVASVPGLHAVSVIDKREPNVNATGSYVVVASRSQAALAPVLALKGARAANSAGMAVWTDDYSNILAALISNYK